jgi:hypothetical protein
MERTTRLSITRQGARKISQVRDLEPPVRMAYAVDHVLTAILRQSEEWRHILRRFHFQPRISRNIITIERSQFAPGKTTKRPPRR